MDKKEGPSMTRLLGAALALAGLTLAATTIVGCGERAVSYSAQVQPIIEQRCMECHQPGEHGYEESGLEMTSYASLMQGTRFGPIIEPGEPMNSVLNQLVEGRAHPSIAMPHGRDRLPDSEIALLRRWVEQGALDN
jgi:mono/diheme cytochrome c family protein